MWQQGQSLGARIERQESVSRKPEVSSRSFELRSLLSRIQKLPHDGASRLKVNDILSNVQSAATRERPFHAPHHATYCHQCWTTPPCVLSRKACSSVLTQAQRAVHRRTSHYLSVILPHLRPVPPGCAMFRC